MSSLQITTALIATVTLIGVAIGRWPWLRMNRATITLLGSVANLIVAEIAKRRGVHLSFGEYLKAGTPIAIMTLILGVVWLSW